MALGLVVYCAGKIRISMACIFTLCLCLCALLSEFQTFEILSVLVPSAGHLVDHK